MRKMKKFVGEYAYNIIKNIGVDNEALRKALITPQNARAVFSDLDELEVKSLCTEISNSGTIGQVRKTTQEEIIQAFHSVGYDKVIFDNEKEIEECKKYYRPGEVICTYNNLNSRMRNYHMLVAVKANIDEIERSQNPERDDEYGTSILNIQIAKNGSHMSIKNRYNHTVSEPDSTLNNDLDMLYMGLQSMVLGYYGFASLGSKRSHYKDIINIDGVYLKYHTECDNIYYGSFVLDGVNGVRFADAGRYYVTMGKSQDNYDRDPLVLDFKSKKAIEVSPHSSEINGKAPLLTRALKEGVLSSRNKAEADTLKVSFPDAKKELLSCRRHALQYTHDVYGYDFTKPYKVTGFLGRFTAKSIEKETGSNTGVLLIYSRQGMRVCELNNGKFKARDLRRIYGYNIDHYYTQGQFEADRKSGNTAMYFIQQEKQYIGKPKPEEKRSYYLYGQNQPEFDKSGYNLTEARSALERRVAKYRQEKLAKEAAKVDFSQNVIEIENSFAELKNEIITKLTEAKTSEDYKKISNTMDYSFVWMVRAIEDIQRRVNEKSFTSVSSARDKIERVKADIAKFKLRLV